MSYNFDTQRSHFSTRIIYLGHLLIAVGSCLLTIGRIQTAREDALFMQDEFGHGREF